jgi:ParB-like chromosome segregation protein Spo0J
MSKQQIKVEMWAVERLIPYEKNAKIHTQAQIEALAQVIKTQGWDVPIVVDKDGVVIKGHGRRLTAIHMGLKEVPVICRSDLTPAQVKAARLSDNRVALTEFDTALIKEELSALNIEGFDMTTIGFNAKELDMMIRDLDTVNVSVFEGSEPAPDASADSDDKPSDKPQETQDKTVELAAVLGFKVAPASAERTLIKFQSYAESMTGKRGAQAFAEFCGNVVSEIEARG